MFGSGRYSRIFLAVGSMRLPGMILPGNGSRMNRAGFVGSGRVVAGSYSCCGHAEKSPLRKAAVGIDRMLVVSASRKVYLLNEKKKNALFFASGPPIVPPHS